MTNIPASGIDDNRGMSYQAYVAIEILIKEFKNSNFTSIILESPKNQIEDNNVIYRDRIRFIQVKKRDQEHWTRSRLKVIFDHFYNIFINPLKCFYELNLPDYINYDLQFEFITDGELNSKLSTFNRALEKFKLQEMLDEDDEKSLNLFKDEKYNRYTDFLNCLKLKKKHCASSNINDICETIRIICISELSRVSHLDYEESQSVIYDLFNLCMMKYGCYTVVERTLNKEKLNELVSKKKNLDLIQDEQLEIKKFKKILSEIILEIEDEIQYDINIATSKRNLVIDVPIFFKLNSTSYYVSFFPQIITPSILNAFASLEYYIIKERKGVPIFVMSDVVKDFGGINQKFCVPLEKEKVLEFLKKNNIK